MGTRLWERGRVINLLTQTQPASRRSASGSGRAWLADAKAHAGVVRVGVSADDVVPRRVAVGG